MISAVLFDLDGTLVDSNDQHVAVWEQVLAETGHPRERAAIHVQIGKGADNFVPALIPGADETLIKRLGDAHGDLFKRDHLAHIRPFPQAHALLAELYRRGVRLAFASSASAHELDHYLDLLDARELVAVTTSADDVAHSKPGSDVFRLALQRLGVQGANAIAVGDTPYDVEAAAGAGVGTIALRSGKFADVVLQAAGPVALYDGVADLLVQLDTSPLAASSSSRLSPE